MTEIQKVIDEAMAEVEKPKMQRATQAQPLTNMEVVLALVLLIGLPLMLFFAGAQIGLLDF